MNVVFKPKAEETLQDIAEFIDDINLPGAGDRWAEKFVDHIYKIARLDNLRLTLCHNGDLANAGFSCTTYKGWVIVFKIESRNFVVYQIILGSLLY